MMKILIYDIECLLECFFVGIYIAEENKRYEFGVNQWENSLDGFIKFIEEHKEYFWCGYNNLKYDSQIIEWVLRNYEKWNELPGLEICRLISQESSDNIDNSNYGLFSKYRENELTLKQLDLPAIWHFFNENRKLSLKALEFSINYENIEEMPLHHLTKNLKKEQILDIKEYCFNDVMATYQFYLITIGQTDFKLYKGKNKINDRLIIEQEIGLKCLNFDDVKIGASWNMMDYCSLTGRSERDLKPKKVNHFYGKKYKQFFPKTVEFQTKELKEFVRNLGETFIINKKQEFPYKFHDKLIVNIARGGIHSQEKPRWLIPSKEEIYYQCDIGSQYPNAIRKYKIYPSHLGKEWNEMLVGKIQRRLNYKKLAKETKEAKYESLQEMGKLALNGGAYGRLNTQGDWQEDPCSMLKITIGCQLEILMIVEALVLKGFNVVSVNTDGYDVIIPKNRDVEFKELCSYYEELIGNKELGNIEYTQFKWIAQTSVNDYIALKMDGTTKNKGDFEIDKELYKNTSNRIIPIALEEFYKNNVPIEHTIRNHQNIYDFCIRQKASKDFHYEGVSKGGTNIYKKLIRYYVSIEGEEIFKIKEESCQTNASPRSIIEKNEDTGRGYKVKVCNFLSKDTRVNEAGINFDYYISKTQRIIDKVALGGKKPIKKVENQLNMFI